MLVFVDESGDSGMKGKRGSSEHFIVAAVFFNDNDSASDCDARISSLRRQLHLDARAEFHFNKCCNAHRERFIEAVAPADFFYLAFVLNKAKLWGPGFAYKETFHKYATRLLFENAKPHLSHSTITLDRSGDRDFTHEMESYLKKRINTDSEKIRKVKSEPSHSNNLLQLADMVCGAVARSFKPDKSDFRLFRKKIGHRELEVQVWPKS